MAIDRELIIQVAMYNYTSIAHQTGLSGVFSKYRIKENKIIEDWITFDPNKSIKLIHF